MKSLLSKCWMVVALAAPLSLAWAGMAQAETQFQPVSGMIEWGEDGSGEYHVFVLGGTSRNEIATLTQEGGPIELRSQVPTKEFPAGDHKTVYCEHQTSIEMTTSSSYLEGSLNPYKVEGWRRWLSPYWLAYGCTASGFGSPSLGCGSAVLEGVLPAGGLSVYGYPDAEGKLHEPIPALQVYCGVGGGLRVAATFGSGSGILSGMTESANSIVSNQANPEEKNRLVTEWHWHGTGAYAGRQIEASGVAR